MKTFYVKANKTLENGAVVSIGKHYYKVIDKTDFKTFIIEELATGEPARCVMR